MRRTMHAIAATVICATCGTPLAGAATWSAQVADEPLENDDAAPGVIADPEPAPRFTFEDDDAGSFSWTSETALTPPPFAVGTDSPDLVPPIGSSTAIPLPPGAWTGLASLGTLGGVSLLRRLKRRR